MAYKQTPGRGNSPKTGHGLPSALKQIDPKLQKAKEDEDKAKRAVASYKSNKKLNTSELGIEVAAAKDSIAAANPKNQHLYTKEEKVAMGNKAANKTRAINFAGTTVEKSIVNDRRIGPKTVYKRK